MIFVTVGTQLPFDRMIRAIDLWAGNQGRSDVFAQIGPTEYRPKHVRWSQFVDAQEFRQHVAEADLIIAHAGMGSIITALEMGKPIVVMPRSAQLREHRNDHQLATARRFLAQGRIMVAFDETHLVEKLNDSDRFQATTRITAGATPELLTAIRSFILTGSVPHPTAGPETVGLDDSPSAAPAPFQADAKA